MSILDKIIAHKRSEVEKRRELYPVKYLEQSIYFLPEPVSMKKYIRRPDLSGIIAEIKRKSPSKGMINPHVSVERTSIGYMQAGASGLSVLTDTEFFGGSNEDLTTARKYNFCPILRKDFIVDEYQIIEAKSIGADIILLIAAGLVKSDCAQLTQLAKSLGMEVLLEIHQESELDFITPEIDVVGINNRNLSTFETTLETSFRLAKMLPQGQIKISESGIKTPSDLLELREHGFDGFLIGENFMTHSRPEEACALFIDQLRTEGSYDRDNKQLHGQTS